MQRWRGSSRGRRIDLILALPEPSTAAPASRERRLPDHRGLPPGQVTEAAEFPERPTLMARTKGPSHRPRIALIAVGQQPRPGPDQDEGEGDHQHAEEPRPRDGPALQEGQANDHPE